MHPHKPRSSRSQAPASAWLAAATLVFAVCLLGGSSRPDTPHLLALRPLAALSMIPAALALRSEAVAAIRAPLLILVALGLIMTLQIIPLPPVIWHELPKRDLVSAIDAIVGLEDQWRPISLVPSRTLNALASLVVPLAALLVYCSFSGRQRRLWAPFVITGIGLASVLIGFLQTAGIGGGILYHYPVTMEGKAVGLFANSNHAGVLSAITMLVIANIGLHREYNMQGAAHRFLIVAAFLFALVGGLVSSSRAGVLTTALAFLVVLAMVGLRMRAERLRTTKGRRGTNPGVLIGAGVLALGAIGFILVYLWGAEVMVPDEGETVFEEVRFQLLPVLIEMVKTFWLFGSGFGTFEKAYHIFEPTALLTPRYINQAHNDWLQIVIEGGLPAMAIIAAGLAWFLRGFVSFSRAGGGGPIRAVFWLSTFAIISLASLVDYPLRAPLFQFIAVWLLALFAEAKAERDARPVKSG